MPKVISVIETEVLRGKGVENDPARNVKQYWSLDGVLLAERDPVTIEWERKNSEDAHLMRQGLIQKAIG